MPHSNTGNFMIDHFKSSAPLGPSDIVRALVRHPKRWMVPTLAVTLAGVVYAWVRPASWEASQTLVVRNEAHGTTSERLGKFGHVDEMKTALETIIELAKSRSVLEAALARVGPPADHPAGSAWPTDEDLASLASAIKVAPPNGAELGRTEVFYVRIRAGQRERAIALVEALVDSLQARYRRLLDERAASMIAELEKAATLADRELARATARLGELELLVGSDLAELRILHETPSGSSDLRQKAIAVQNDLRDAETNHRAAVELVSLLEAAREDHTQLAALPDRLLGSHRTLSLLIEGLNAARLRTANLLGSKSTDHPLARAAVAEEQEVLANLRGELDSAIRIAEVDQRLGEARVQSLRRQLAETTERLERLAGLRARYSTLLAETKSLETLAQEARRNLGDARAIQAAVGSSQLIARVDAAHTGPRPQGPGKSFVVLLAVAGGLAIGLGIVFLSVDPRRARPISPPAVTVNGNGRTVEAMLKSNGTLSLRQALTRIADEA
jgi:polysaccharide biosynthesis transport protein